MTAMLLTNQILLSKKLTQEKIIFLMKIIFAQLNIISSYNFFYVSSNRNQLIKNEIK